MLELILCGVLLFALFYYYGIQPMNYLRKLGVKQGKATWFIGDNLNVLLRKESVPDSVIRYYNQYPSERYSGIYSLTLPILLIRDPELIKQLGVKDFDYFVDHKSFLPENANPLWSKNLFALKGQKWKEMRPVLSPSFTSSKMKAIFILMSEVAETFVDYFQNKNEDIIEADFKDIFTRYGNDVIASVVFGVKINSLEDRNNHFYLMGKELTNVGGFWKTLKLLGYVLAPKLYDFLGVSIFSEELTKFFTKLIDETIKIREETGVVRNDMINLLLEARRGGKKKEETIDEDAGFATAQEIHFGKGSDAPKKEITNMDIAAQAMIFFFAGFDSVTSVMSFMAYELAINPDVQSRLRDEIELTSEKCNGKVTYESLMKMKYMDMVLSETLRKWPPFVTFDRVCTKSYTIQPTDPNDKPLNIEKGTNLWFPVFGLHYDPKNYPEPQKFDPERFSDENKHNINPFAYIPFGVGPRNCIGSRFALMECKAVFYHLLLNFELVPIKKSNIPMKLAKSVFNLQAEGGNWLGLKRISK